MSRPRASREKRVSSWVVVIFRVAVASTSCVVAS
jgi:hypothetical protein